MFLPRGRSERSPGQVRRALQAQIVDTRGNRKDIRGTDVEQEGTKVIEQEGIPVSVSGAVTQSSIANRNNVAPEKSWTKYFAQASFMGP